MPEITPSTRAVAAEKIVANPSNYKICEGCDSIIGINAALCPNCHSFRFEGSAEQIIRQAKKLGAREQTTVTTKDMA